MSQSGPRNNKNVSSCRSFFSFYKKTEKTALKVVTGMFLRKSVFLKKYGTKKQEPFESFFAKSAQIKLNSPQTECLSILFVGKSVVLPRLEGPKLRTHY